MAYLLLPHQVDTEARKVLGDALDEAAVNAQTMREPEVVRSLAQKIAATLPGASASGVQITATVGFIHQASYVQFPKGGGTCRCEAGDLLVIVTRVVGAASATRAVLLQAKCHGGKVLTSVGAADAQHFLYLKWPTITYTFGAAPGSTTRTLKAAVQRQGGRYLTIPRGPVQGAVVGVCVAKPGGVLGAPEPAVDYFMNMLRTKSAVAYKPNGPQEWDGLVDDLLVRARKRSSSSLGKERLFSLHAQADGEDGGHALDPGAGEDPRLTILRITVSGE